MIIAYMSRMMPSHVCRNDGLLNRGSPGDPVLILTIVLAVEIFDCHWVGKWENPPSPRVLFSTFARTFI